MIALLWSALVGWAQAPPEAEEDCRGFTDQAEFFVRRGFWNDALLELEKAVAHPNCRVDPEAWFVLARVRFELTDLEGAIQAADRAHTYSRTEDELAQASGYEAFLRDEFGMVEVRAPFQGLATRLLIEPQSPIFNLESKGYLDRLQAGLRRKVVLPYRFGLPVGSYAINGAEVLVSPGETAALDLSTGQLRTRAAFVKLAQVEVGVGLASWLGSDVSNLLPSLTAGVSVTNPIAGPITAGVMADWTPQTYLLANGDTDLHPAGWSLGARLGAELLGTEPLVFRLSVGYRFATVHGLELACASRSGDFSCTRDGPADLVVYSVGRAHVPLLELSIDHLDKRRTGGVGFGVKGVVEHAFGTLPARAHALRVDDDSSVTYTIATGSRRWSGTSVRVHANFSLAF